MRPTENQKLYSIIVGTILVLSFSCYLIALSHGLWREFYITVGYLVVIGLALSYLLRRPSEEPTIKKLARQLDEIS